MVIDFMPLRGTGSEIVRTVVGTRGRLRMRTEMRFRFDYGSVIPWVSRLDDGTLRAIAGPDMILVRAPIELHGESMTTQGRVRCRRGRAAVVRDDVGSVASSARRRLRPRRGAGGRRALLGRLERVTARTGASIATP